MLEGRGRVCPSSGLRLAEGRGAAPRCALTVGWSLSLHFCCCGGHCAGCLICCCCCWQGAGGTGTCPGTVTTGPWGGRTTTGVTSCTAVTSWQVSSSEPWQEEPPRWQEELSVLWQPLSPREHIVRLVWGSLEGETYVVRHMKCSVLSPLHFGFKIPRHVYKPAGGWQDLPVYPSCFLGLRFHPIVPDQHPPPAQPHEPPGSPHFHFCWAVCAVLPPSLRPPHPFLPLYPEDSWLAIAQFPEAFPKRIQPPSEETSLWS